MTLHRNSALQAGVGQIFDRVLSELSLKMRTLRMDQAEYVALKAIILLNPGQYHTHTSQLYFTDDSVRQIFDRQVQFLRSVNCTDQTTVNITAFDVTTTKSVLVQLLDLIRILESVNLHILAAENTGQDLH